MAKERVCVKKLFFFRLRKKKHLVQISDCRLQIAELRTRILWVALLLEIVTKLKGGEQNQKQELLSEKASVAHKAGCRKNSAGGGILWPLGRPWP